MQLTNVNLDKKHQSIRSVRNFFYSSVVLMSFLTLVLIIISYFLDISGKQVKYNIYNYLRSNVPNYYADFSNRNLSIDDVLITVRTSRVSQSVRMPAILKTWFQFSPRTIYIITNGNLTSLHEQLPQDLHQQIFQSNCSPHYTIRDLCCQSGKEFDIFFKQKNRYKWLCRFDDDQYVNVPLLVNYLGQFQSDKQLLYIGKPSWDRPKEEGGIKFWFATYGGGICFSRLLLQMIRNDTVPSDKFISGCVTSALPDDVYTGYLLKKRFNVTLTIAEKFHHHLERDLFTKLTNASTINNAITLGFKDSNVPHFVPFFKQDIFHMQTLHCLLYPTDTCMARIRSLLNQLYKEEKKT